MSINNSSPVGITSSSWLAVFVLGLLMCPFSEKVHAQLVFGNFETAGDTDGFMPAIPPDFPDSSYLEHEQVFGTGNTNGTGALRVEFGDALGSFAWAIRHDLSAEDADLTEYNMFNTVAAAEEDWFLEFDLFVPENEWSDPELIDPGSTFQLRASVNSDEGFVDVENVSAAPLNFFTGSQSIRIPMEQLPMAQDSTFYQFNIGSVSNFTQSSGTPPEGIDIYFDNFRFTQALPTLEKTLFSWETPDEPETPINEQFEGWDTIGFNPTDAGLHVHSITSVGATDGDSALQIDRQNLPGDEDTFVWGSTFELNSDVNPDPEVEEIDPQIQAEIDDLASMINMASAFAFDVRFDDPFPFAPTFTIFEIAVNDATGHFFQGSGIVIGATEIGDATTYTIQTSSMGDRSTLDAGILSEAGVDAGNTLTIGLSTNSDGGGIYQIDNFRLIIELSTADFDADGDVDGRDFLIWQRNLGDFNGDAQQSDGDTNGDGFVDEMDLANWQSQYGNTSTTVNLSSKSLSAVPEPSSVALFSWALLLARRLHCRKRFSSEELNCCS